MSARTSTDLDCSGTDYRWVILENSSILLPAYLDMLRPMTVDPASNTGRLVLFRVLFSRAQAVDVCTAFTVKLVL